MRVLIGEDEALLREGLALILAQAGFDIVGSCRDADDLVRRAMAHRPDLVVTDIRMPPHHADDGLKAAQRIRRHQPATAVLVLSQYVQRSYALELLGTRPEGVGYLLKQRIADTDAFCRDVRRICDGGTVLDPEVVSTMLARAGREHGVIGRLTPRQREVLALIAEGRSNAAIARDLAITGKAVVQHTSHIYDALGLAETADDHRRVLAVLRYLSG